MDIEARRKRHTSDACVSFSFDVNSLGEGSVQGEEVQVFGFTVQRGIARIQGSGLRSRLSGFGEKGLGFRV